MSVNETREEDRITNEEDWRVVANQIPVAFLCIELDGKTTRISDSISRAALTSHSGKADSNWSFLSNFSKDSSFAVFAYIMSHFKMTKSTCKKHNISKVMGYEKNLCSIYQLLWRELLVQVYVHDQNEQSHLSKHDLAGE